MENPRKEETCPVDELKATVKAERDQSLGLFLNSKGLTGLLVVNAVSIKRTVNGFRLFDTTEHEKLKIPFSPNSVSCIIVLVYKASPWASFSKVVLLCCLRIELHSEKYHNFQNTPT